MMLEEKDKKALLLLARKSIEDHLDPNASFSPGYTPPEHALPHQCGAFVSLYVDDQLRGCIGTFSEEENLWVNVRNMAVSAATTDSRFDPILLREIQRLAIEISVLTPRTRVYDISQIVIGKHGLFMRQGTKRGTLLPQVAVTQNWDVKQFLGHCSKYKAGLGWEGWKTAELYIYEAIVFKSPPPIAC
jgi:AmmeMemoRadiSam system protein A